MLLELFKLGLAANELASIRRRRGFRGNAAQAPDTDPRVNSPELKFSDRLADAALAERAIDALRKQRLAGGRGGDKPRSEVHRVAEHRIVWPSARRTLPATTSPLAIPICACRG